MADRIFGLIGRSLKHSYSVPIHRELGNEAYRLFELEPEDLCDFLHRDKIGGLNVTIPYKRDVMEHLDVISPEAREIGSVNTIVKCSDGRLHGYNTDAEGFKYMLKRAGISPGGRKVVILGSGGSSLTVRYVAKTLGASEIVVVSRTGADNYENISRHYDADIIVNTTPVGMYPNVGESLIDLEKFVSCKGVLDLIYNPMKTALIMQAEELNIPHSSGLPMLVSQAKAAEELFFKKKIADSENERVVKKLLRQSRNIVLIGMPGCGKSTIGAELSKISGRETIDIDEKIVQRAHRSIPEIFEINGEEEFRRLEREETALAGSESGKIIMTGGGVVNDERNYPHLHQNGRIYFIDRSPHRLARQGRPLSENADLTAMYRERLPMYKRFCDVTVDGNVTAREVAGAIWRDFCEDSCN